MEQNYVIKHILKRYDMEVDVTQYYRKETSTRDGLLRVRVEIDFIPKKITDNTPKIVTAIGIMSYSMDPSTLKYNYSFDKMSYIRKEDMPFLPFIDGEYELDTFCEKIVEDEFMKIVNKYF